MPRLVDRLTVRRVASIVAGRTPGMFPDGEGLYLQMTPRGSASWVVVYRRAGKRRKMGLGPVRLVTLAEARAKRDAAHKMLRFEGKDPLAHRAGRRRKQASAFTFREAARRYITDTEAKRKDPKSLRAWLMTLLGEQPDGTKTEHDYCATLHELPVGEVDIGAVLDVLKPIWASKPETASRLRGRIEKVIDFAIVHGLAGDAGPEHQNPARWKGRLEHALPAKGEVRETKHHAALPYEAVPAFMKTLRTREGPPRAAWSLRSSPRRAPAISSAPIARSARRCAGSTSILRNGCGPSRKRKPTSNIACRSAVRPSRCLSASGASIPTTAQESSSSVTSAASRSAMAPCCASATAW
jgi:hypothetical protein